MSRKPKYRGSIKMTFEELAEILNIPPHLEVINVYVDQARDVVTVKYRSDDAGKLDAVYVPQGAETQAFPLEFVQHEITFDIRQ